MSEAGVVITQVIAPGRGIEMNSDLFPGTVQPGSLHSSDSYDRAVTTARYALLHDEVECVVFSGGMSFMIPGDKRPDASEAGAMESVAWEHWAGIPSKTERKSGTTVGNFAESVQAGLLDPTQVTGIVVDEAQRQNAVWAARLVMPGTVIRVISSRNNPDLKVTLPDVRIDTDEHPMEPTRNDRVFAALYRAAMFGVRPGNLNAIIRRDRFVQRQVLRARWVGQVIVDILSSSNQDQFMYTNFR